MTEGTNVGEMASFLDRIERLEEEKKALGEDISEVWKEAKDRGYDTGILRKAYSIRKMQKDARAVLHIYVDSLGLFD